MPTRLLQSYLPISTSIGVTQILKAKMAMMTAMMMTDLTMVARTPAVGVRC